LTVIDLGEASNGRHRYRKNRIEEANGWIKEVGGMAQTKYRGLDRVGWMFTFKAAACNLIRLPKLLPTG
jgi:hypothetical protein